MGSLICDTFPKKKNKLLSRSSLLLFLRVQFQEGH
jgi:hypothetical protein